MGPSLEPRKVHAISLDWTTTQPLRHGVSQTEHLCIHFHAQLFEEFPYFDMGISYRSHRTELRVPFGHIIWRVYTVHKALGCRTAWVLLVYETQSYIRYEAIHMATRHMLTI
jgi:hypothetical protein